MVSKQTMVRLSFFMTLLTLVLVMLGAYVRLSDAGLGCPDWPGCYGHVGVPKAEHEIAKAEAVYPERPVEAHKAWKEMVHRYIAGALGLLILALAVLAWQRRHLSEQMVTIPLLLVGLVIFQALLGMWTVTLLLQPIVVTAHLLGGLATLALIWWFTLRQGRWFMASDHFGDAPQRLRPFALFALVVVIIQIFLGGWTSTNYAALICPDFPTCHGSWWPAVMNFDEGFMFWHHLDEATHYRDFEHALHLSGEAKMAIHVVHRLGALLTFLIITGLLIAALLTAAKYRAVKRIAILVFVLLLIQIGLGIANVEWQLPLWVAVLHNGGAALLFMSIIALNHVLNPLPPE